jgi:aldehyde:ferredoxin oxidoreductase
LRLNDSLGRTFAIYQSIFVISRSSAMRKSPKIFETPRHLLGFPLLGDLLELGQHATNMARVFIAREGVTREGVTLPERLLFPLERGILVGEALPRDEFETALTGHNILKGWKPEAGMAARERLQALELAWVVNSA